LNSFSARHSITKANVPEQAAMAPARQTGFSVNAIRRTTAAQGCGTVAREMPTDWGFTGQIL
jgi:hypothetical protein